LAKSLAGWFATLTWLLGRVVEDMDLDKAQEEITDHETSSD
jgi:hypothetical protein